VGSCSLVVAFAAGPLLADPLGEITTVATGGETPGFTAGSQPGAITTGPDGNLWFLEGANPSAVARITFDGAVTEFPVPGDDLSLSDITTGPDGAVWFTNFQPPGGVYRVTTDGTVTLVADGGVTANFPAGNVEDIVAGPDGNLWITRPFLNPVDELVQFTPAGVVTSFGAGAGLPADATLRFLTVGPDGNLYVTDSGQGAGEPSVENRVWRFDLSSNTFELVAEAGTTPGFTAGNPAGDIVTGPDANLWFIVPFGTTPGIARLTTACEVTEFTDGVSTSANLRYLAVGCDDGLWFTQSVETGSDPTIWRASTDGVLTSYTDGLPSTNPSPEGITAGPDDNLWFTSRLDPGSVSTIGAGPCGQEPAPIVLTPTFTG
jgi:virginiamycin B lyase